ncbi:hypothetical protein SAMN05421755_104211 [Nitrosomonas sp. Nm33]|nr:hypothetical protein SAMN05421755_104211 [Nitrosomonas sp. Nm33]
MESSLANFIFYNLYQDFINSSHFGYVIDLSRENNKKNSVESLIFYK